jgi:hypothetical protein
VRTPLVLVAVALVLTAAAAAAALPPPGQSLPDAPLETIDGRHVGLLSLERGRPMIIFYESKDVRQQNQPLKLKLWQLGHDPRLRDAVVVVPVADVHRYGYWPARPIARGRLHDEEHRIDHRVYADWDGSFARAIGARPGESNVILVDPRGRVLLSHAGPLDEPTRVAVLRYLTDYARGEAAAGAR